MVIKSDNELALTKVVEEIGRPRAPIGGQEMVVENSLVHSSKSNGFVRGRSRACSAGEDVEE